MSKQTQETFAKLAADVILAEFPNLNRQSVVNYLKKEHAAFETENLLARVSNAGAPDVPAKDNPAPVSVPDPAKTEGTKSTKQSTPAYGRFLQAVQDVRDAGDELFEIESDDEGPESKEKSDARANALNHVEGLRGAIYDL